MDFVRNKKRWKIGLAAVAIIFVGSLVYRAIAVRVEKNHFLAAQADLEKLFTTIQNTVGKPDQVKREMSCSRPNLKFASGSPVCGVSIDTLYENKNAKQSNELMNRLSKLSTGSIRNGSESTNYSVFISSESQRGDQILYQDIHSFQGLSCVMEYRYPHKTGLLSNAEIKYEENFGISISCNAPSRNQYFPLKD